MKIIITIGLLFAVGYYFYDQRTICENKQDYINKLAELSHKIKQSSNKNNPASVLNTLDMLKSFNNIDNPNDACKAIEEIMDKL